MRCSQPRGRWRGACVCHASKCCRALAITAHATCTMVTAAGLRLLARFVIECLEHRIVLCILEAASHYQVRLSRWGGCTDIKARELQQRHNTYCQLRTGPSGTPLVRPYHDSHYQSQMSIVYADETYLARIASIGNSQSYIQIWYPIFCHYLTLRS